MATLEEAQQKIELLEAWKAGVIAGRDKAPPIVVKTSDRKLRQFTGNSSDLADWIEDAKGIVSCHGNELSDDEATAFLYRHIEGIAREELRMYSDIDRNTADKIFDILRTAFGERRTSAEIKRELYSRSQRDGETVREYARVLVELVNSLPGSQDSKKEMLVEVFKDNVRDKYLRTELRKKVRDEPTVGFTVLRDYAVQLSCDSEVPLQAKVRSVVPEREPDKLHHLEQQFKAMETRQMEILEMLGRFVSRDESSTSIPPARGATLKDVQCYWCTQYGHIQRNCPHRRRKMKSHASQESSSTSSSSTEAANTGKAKTTENMAATRL